MKSYLSIGVIGLLGLLTTSFAQTIWTDGGQDSQWSTLGNWSTNVVPISSTAVQIGTQPTGDQIGVDTGATTIASFTFNNTLTHAVDVTLFQVGDALQVNGAIANNSGFTNSFSLPVTAGASAIWTGPLSFTAQTVFGTNQITLSNAISFTNSLSFDITNTTTYGRFLGSGNATVTGATINIGGTYAGNSGDTFDLTTGTFAGATIGTLPTLSNGLSWNSSTFLTNGVLTVTGVPEPATWALLTASLTTVMILRRRKTRR